MLKCWNINKFKTNMLYSKTNEEEKQLIYKCYQGKYKQPEVQDTEKKVKAHPFPSGSRTDFVEMVSVQRE